MVGIERLLLNMVFIIVPILCYQIFWIRFHSAIEAKSKVIAICMSLSVILCMTFPFQIIPGFIYDLRTIPFIIAFVYGGYRAGILTAVVLYVYRIILGGEGMWNVFIVYTSILILIVWMAWDFQTYSKRTKYVGTITISVLTALLMVMNTMFLADFPDGVTIPLIGYVILHAVTMGLTVHVIELLRLFRTLLEDSFQKEKRALISDLAVAIAHEIRNPLTAVQGFIQLLIQEQGEEKRKYYASMSLQELGQAEVTIRQYLSLVQKADERKCYQTFHVGKQIRQVIDKMVAFALSRNVQIREVFQNSSYIHSDPEKFAQILMNFIKNGIEQMPTGGLLDVKSLNIGNDLVIHISDTGKGLSEEEIKRLGTLYYDTTATGTGLDLLIAYKMVESLNGKVEVHSQKGKGTNFSITIPMQTSVDLNREILEDNFIIRNSMLKKEW